MCQRNLRLPVAWITGGAVLLFAMLGFLLWNSGRIKQRMEYGQVSSEDVLKAAESLVAANPTVHNPVGFSGIEQSTVEHWDGPRWRVSGYVDTRPQPGVKVRTLYYAVLLRDGRAWDMEDLQLQRMVSASPSRHPR